MIQLERHIEILLLDNDCVIVPGLGGFVTHHVEARYDEADGLFLPPLRTLGFNPQLKLNDSLLAQSYVEAYDISYPEALRRIEAEVLELKQTLADEGCYELNDIGVLSLNDEGNCVFEPCEAGLLTPELYGLGSFSMAEGESAVKEEAKAIVTPMPRSRKIAVEETSGGEKTISIKVSWLRNAVAVAAAIIAFFLFTPPVSNNQQAAMAFGGVQAGMLQQLMQEGLEKGEASVSTFQGQAQDAPTLTLDTSSLAVTVQPAVAEVLEKRESPAEKGFCIVMASCVPKSGAEAFVRKLHAEGYDQASVYTRNKVVRVVYGNYKTEAEAQNELRVLRGNTYFEQSWVYEKR